MILFWWGFLFLGEGDDLSLGSTRGRGMSGRPQGHTVGLMSHVVFATFYSSAVFLSCFSTKNCPYQGIAAFLTRKKKLFLKSCFNYCFQSSIKIFLWLLCNWTRHTSRDEPNEIGSNKKKQSELICCSGGFSVSQKAWARLGIHHCGKSDSVLILNGL